MALALRLPGVHSLGNIRGLFREQELGNARLYDLCVNTSDYGLERTVELILEAINTRTEQSSAVETVPVRSASFPEPEEDRIPGEISLA